MEQGRGFSVLSSKARHASGRRSRPWNVHSMLQLNVFSLLQKINSLLQKFWFVFSEFQKSIQGGETSQASKSIMLLMREPLSNRLLCLQSFTPLHHKACRWACENPWRGVMRMGQRGNNLLSSLNLGPETVPAPVQNSRECPLFFFLPLNFCLFFS